MELWERPRRWRGIPPAHRRSNRRRLVRRSPSHLQAPPFPPPIGSNSGSLARRVNRLGSKRRVGRYDENPQPLSPAIGHERSVGTTAEVPPARRREGSLLQLPDRDSCASPRRVPTIVDHVDLHRSWTTISPIYQTRAVCRRTLGNLQVSKKPGVMTRQFVQNYGESVDSPSSGMDSRTLAGDKPLHR